MPGQPCARHPDQITLIRCSRCESPICPRCRVDTPVGARCRACSSNRAEGAAAESRNVWLAFLTATAAAVPAGWLLHHLPFVLFLSPIYGYLVAEAALRAGKRRSGRSMEWAVGIAALIGGTVGALLHTGPAPAVLLEPWTIAVTGIGVVVAVSRVRYW